jgi:hypothetical protein
MSMPPSIQVFTNGLNGATAGVTSPFGGNPDELEILGSDGASPLLRVCASDPADSANPTSVQSAQPLPGVLTNSPSSQLMLLATPGAAGLAWKAVGAATNCEAVPPQFPLAGPGGGTIGLLPWRAMAVPDVSPSAGAPTGGVVTMAHAARYQIQMDAAQVPNLWRSSTGGADVGGNPNYQLVARGIEDLQVEYRTAAGWANVPGPVTCAVGSSSCAAADIPSLVQEVRVTLTARALGQRLQGATQPTTGAVLAPRGQLTSTTTPRAVLFHLSQATGGPAWR